MPDHYLTEYAHPDAARRREVVGELERFRGMGPRDVLARALLLGGYSFGSVDLSGAATSAGADLDPAGPVLALATPPVLGRATQERLAAFVEAGGRLLLHGVLPTLDDDGTDVHGARGRARPGRGRPGSRARRTTSRPCGRPPGPATSPRSASASCSG